ncbi:MAG: methylmalonyl-CoA mutase family protein, partial [Mycobacteriales bacterium]
AYEVAKGIDTGERIVVGLNKFKAASEEKYDPLRVDPQIEVDQRARLADLRARRDSAAVEAALEALKKAAAGTDNVLYPMKDALKALATVGEVCNALREVWGVHRPQEFF